MWRLYELLKGNLKMSDAQIERLLSQLNINEIQEAIIEFVRRNER